MPIGESPISLRNSSTIFATTLAQAFGVDFFGVGIRMRLPVSAPVCRSTGAPLTPDPPMSMPRMWCGVEVMQAMLGPETALGLVKRRLTRRCDVGHRLAG